MVGTRLLRTENDITIETIETKKKRKKQEVCGRGKERRVEASQECGPKISIRIEMGRGRMIATNIVTIHASVKTVVEAAITVIASPKASRAILSLATTIKNDLVTARPLQLQIDTFSKQESGN